jgi:murein DD-endopeptidase MepM/ murein hydrolase activator NlpD
MKRLVALTIFLLSAIVLQAQDTIKQPNWFERVFLGRSVIVHDTVYVVLQDYDDEEDPDEDDNDEISGGIGLPIDTLSTEDKFLKVILFDNGSWVYYDIPKPELPDFISNDHWMTDQVHAYFDINVQDLPDELDLVLCDSIHGWCIPGIGKIVSPYKVRKGHKHQGVDLGVGFGNPIYAAFDGVVRVALPPKLTGGYGNVVVLRHANGLETYYGHLTNYIVAAGELVRAGEVIGYCGSTGRSSGPHLHFETRYMGQSFDPERIFDFEGGTLRDTVFTLKKHYFSIYSHEGQSDKESKAASGRVIYTVKKGDTLGAIAKKNGTTVSAICKLNGISEKKTLQIGQKLIVR